jgi:hypothetical protein
MQYLEIRRSRMYLPQVQKLHVYALMLYVLGQTVKTMYSQPIKNYLHWHKP